MRLRALVNSIVWVAQHPGPDVDVVLTHHLIAHVPLQYERRVAEFDRFRTDTLREPKRFADTVPTDTETVRLGYAKDLARVEAKSLTVMLRLSASPPRDPDEERSQLRRPRSGESTSTPCGRPSAIRSRRTGAAVFREHRQLTSIQTPRIGVHLGWRGRHDSSALFRHLSVREWSNRMDTRQLCSGQTRGVRVQQLRALGSPHPNEGRGTINPEVLVSITDVTVTEGIDATADFVVSLSRGRPPGP